MSCCNKTYETNINNTPVVLTEITTGCYISRFKTEKTKVGKRVKKSSQPCCDNIDITKFKRVFEWIDGECLNGVLTYDTIRYTSKEQTEIITIPDNIKPQELVNLLADYRLTLQRAVELVNTRVTNTSRDCKEEYCNTEIIRPISIICPVGETSNISQITVPACQFTSIISVQDANNQAEVYIDQIKNDFIANNLTCTPNTRYCNEEVSGSILKSNCPAGTLPQLVPVTILANTLCNYSTQETANLAAQNLLNSQLQTEALTSDPVVYCIPDIIDFPNNKVSWYAQYGPNSDSPGTTIIIEQGTNIFSTNSTVLNQFAVGQILRLKYINQFGQIVTRTGTITTVNNVGIFIKDLLLTDILSLQQQTTISPLLIKNLFTNAVYSSGSDANILLPI